MNIKDIRIENYDYPLPESRIATHPLPVRDECLLLYKDPDGLLSTRSFRELPGLLPPDSMLVYNNTRVINARLRFRKGEDSEGARLRFFVWSQVSLWIMRVILHQHKDVRGYAL